VAFSDAGKRAPACADAAVTIIRQPGLVIGNSPTKVFSLYHNDCSGPLLRNSFLPKKKKKNNNL